MSVNFPTDRPGAGLGSGPLQQGDSWRFNSIEYTWVITPDGTGIWSSKGINVNPELYVAKADDFSGDVSGDYNSGLDVLRASEAEVADKVASTLTLTFQPAVGPSTTVTYDGSSPTELTFVDTDIAQDVITVTGSEGIDVTGGTNISTNSSVARIRTSQPPTVNNNNYLYRRNGGSTETVRTYRSDRAQYDENGVDLVNQTELTNAINGIDVGGGGDVKVINVVDYRTGGRTWTQAFDAALNVADVGDTVYVPPFSGNVRLSGTVVIRKSFINIHVADRVLLDNNVAAFQIGDASNYVTNCRIFVNDIKGPGTGLPANIGAYNNTIGFDIRHGSFNTIDFNRIVFCHRAININAAFGLCADNKILGQLIEKCRIGIRADGGAVATRNHTEHTMIYTQFIAHYEYGIYKSGEAPGRMGSQKFWDVNSSFDAFPRDNPDTYQYDIYDDYMEVADLDLNACKYVLHFSTGGPNGTGALGDRDDFGGRGCVEGRNCYITEPIRGRFKFSGQSYIDTQVKDEFHIVADDGLWVTESNGVKYKVTGAGSNPTGVTRITAGSGISVNPSNGVGAVTVSATGGGGGGDSHSFGDATLIDDLAIAGGDNPDTLNNWTSYLQQAANIGGSWVFPDRTYQFNQTINFNGRNAVWSALQLGTRPEFQWTGGVPGQPTNNGDRAVIPCCMFCDGNIRFYSLRFSAANGSRAELNQAAYLLFQSTENGSENDSDSSVDWCNFSNIQSLYSHPFAARIVYLGRNFRCTNNVFSSGSRDGDNSGTNNIRCISLSYGLNANGDNNGGGQNLESGGYRRTIIRDNTFHLRNNAQCINCFRVSGTGVGEHFGLNVTGNTIDVGGTLLRITSGHQLNGAVISGNACYRSQNQPYILMEGGAMRNCAITGNTFTGGNSEMPDNENADSFSNCIEILSGAVFNRISITGNSFTRPRNACINFETAVTRVAIVGNTFDDGNRSSNAINLAGGSGAIVGNVSSCNKFINGDKDNFTDANNID